jgi:hypothetical protein
MRKLIHSSFELDLSPFKISDTEENNWFSDNFFLKYSFPFEIDLEDDLDIAFGFISQYNSENVQTYFDLQYVHGDKIEIAVLEVESILEKLSCVLRYGFEQLPSFDKKLSDLSLEKKLLPTGMNIQQHAESIIAQTWPSVNYNFPQVHVDKYDTTDGVWEAFEGIINHRVAGAFLVNTLDEVEEIEYNRNVMQPMPYWIHILERGMIDSGYTLSGAILQDSRLRTACLFGDVDYFTETTKEEIAIVYLNNEWDTLDGQDNGYQYVKFTKEIVITKKGDYQLLGDIDSINYSWHPLLDNNRKSRSFIHLAITKVNQGTESDVFRYDKGSDGDGDRQLGSAIITTSVDASVSFEVGDILRIIKIEPSRDSNPSESPDNPEAISLTLIPIRYRNADGSPILTISNFNDIDLTKAVPAITFGDFIKVIKNWFNYDLDVVDKLAVMNPIEEEINYDNAEDLQFSEIKKPFRKFTKGSSFLLKFQDLESKKFTFLPVFQNRESILTSGYVTDEKTITIEINGLPLPMLNRNGSQSAYAFEENDSKVYLVKYDGIYNRNNLAQPSTDCEIPAVHMQSWKKWFEFRLLAQGFSWSFKAWEEQLTKIKAKRKIFAYNRYHIIKNINKTEDKPGLFIVEIETNTLK